MPLGLGARRGWDSLLILVHAILAVEIEGITAERAAKDVIELVVK